MTGQTILDFLREQTGTTTANLPDPVGIKYLNIAYHDVENAIVTGVAEDFFWELTTTSLVLGQSEYTLDSTIHTNTEGVNKVLNVSVDYYGTGDYKRADRVYPYTNTPSIEWQEANGNTASPRYYIADNSIFLLPKPYKAVTSGMNIRVIQNLVDITTATTEANIFNGRIFRSHHFIIALGAMEYVYQYLKDDASKQEAKANYAMKLYGGTAQNGEYQLGILDKLQNRDPSVIISQMPNLSFLA